MVAPTQEHTAFQAIDRFAKARLLCVGDVMLDRFIYGKVDRISPEAPIPVIRYDHESVMLGGAGNVVRNIVSLGGQCSFVSIVGKDDIGKTITSLTGEQKQVDPYLMVDTRRHSTEKTRYIAGNQQMFRADRETAMPLSKAQKKQLLSTIEQELPNADLVILSDYGKGVLSDAVAQAIITAAEKAGKRVVVDPKSRDLSVYAGAWLLTPNLKELCDAVGRELTEEQDIAEAARALMKEHQLCNMIVTCGARGMVLLPEAGDWSHIPAIKREVYDVSGAGDTVLATLGVALATGCSLEEAGLYANNAAGIVVGRMGTATVYRTDLKAAIHTQDAVSGRRKIFPQDLAADQVASWQNDGLKVGFTNGCFDIVHPGHLSLINDAKAECDRLILAINSDDSVRRLKGETRPVNTEMDRATLLAELAAVDMVVIFREDTPEELLKKLRPDILMKGADYTKEQVVGGDFVESYGGEVRLIQLKDGYSTTQTIARIHGNAGA